MRSSNRVAWYHVAMLCIVTGSGALLWTEHYTAAAPTRGQDPLDVLRLQVKANALVVLDTSGSMGATPDGRGTVAGDHPLSRFRIAKDVLGEVIQANETEISFQLGTYNQSSLGTLLRPKAKSDANPLMRFLYVATSAEYVPGSNPEVQINPSVPRPPAINATALSWAYFDKNGNNSLTDAEDDPTLLLRDRVSDGTGGDYDFTFTSGTPPITYYRLLAGRFYNGQTVNVDLAGKFCGWGTPGPKQSPPYVRLDQFDTCGGASRGGATFRLAGIADWEGVSNSCDGYMTLVNLPPCTTAFQLATIQPYLRNELLLDANGDLQGYTESPTNFAVQTNPTMGGIRQEGFTPIARTLVDLKADFGGKWTSISGQSPTPTTFAIILTDGDDTCPAEGQSDMNLIRRDRRTLGAAFRAEQLYRRIDPSRPESSVASYIVAFGAGVTTQRANWIAWGGSGMSRPTVIDNNDTAGTWDDFERWASAPTPEERAACRTCVDAYPAGNKEQLRNALNAIVERGQQSGTFEASPSVTESVYELSGGVLNPASGTSFDPLSPTSRYDATIPVRVVSSFAMPSFEGHPRAIRNVAGAPQQVWDAGQTLFDRVATNGMMPGMVGGWTFAELHAGATPETIAVSAARIKRRIYSTLRNGVFDVGVANLLDRTAPARVALWPPTAAVDPPSDASGALDDAIGIGAGSATVMTASQLSTEFGACLGSPIPSACSGVTPPSLARRRREARQVILAWMAGARVARDPVTGLPRRNGISRELLYEPQAWPFAESTVAAPAILPPPQETAPSAHRQEYLLLRDGVRAAGNSGVPAYQFGFGLRNPDRDASGGSAPDLRANLKPSMTVAFLPANDMLRAVRMAPCVLSCSDQGGEELWGFVPFDQLGKLALRASNSPEASHTYMLAANARVATIFVPGSFARSIGGTTVSGEGVWRQVLLFGRGAGGQYLTMLDVTSVGSLATTALETPPPLPLWSRGNPDTTDGRPAGPASNAAAPSDAVAYGTFGETWSTPVIVRGSKALFTTQRSPAGIEFVVITGSGYGMTAPQGQTLVTLDALTGDVVHSSDIGAEPSALFPNAIVAGPSAFTARGLSGDALGSSLDEIPSGVYVGDLHGQLWKLDMQDPSKLVRLTALGPTQPLGAPVAQMSLPGPSGASLPHIYVASGNDSRVAGPFKFMALRDDSPPAATTLFEFDLPPGFRGTSQPATVSMKTASGAVDPVVIAATTKFNALGPGDCTSSFDSLLYVLHATAGAAIVDLNASGSDRSTLIAGERVNAVSVSQGTLLMDGGLLKQPPTAPATGAPKELLPGPNASVLTTFVKLGTPVCAGNP
jgi:hypothetical protein